MFRDHEYNDYDYIDDYVYTHTHIYIHIHNIIHTQRENIVILVEHLAWRRSSTVSTQVQSSRASTSQALRWKTSRSLANSSNSGLKDLLPIIAHHHRHLTNNTCTAQRAMGNRVS